MSEQTSKFKQKALWFFHSFIWLGLLLFVIDIVSKSLVVASRDYILSQSSQGIILIPNFLAINYVINTGAAFGLSAGDSEAGYIVNRVVYIVIAVLASAGIIFFYCKKYSKIRLYYRACMMLILCGAIGNLVDRIFYTPAYLGVEHNGVVDWINFFGIWGYNFNIADSCLVIGVIMLIVMLIVEEVQDSRKKNAQFKKQIAAEKASKEEAKKPEENLEEKPAEPKEDKVEN